MIDARIKKIVDHYGTEHQIIKAAEEFSELSSALLHYLDGRGDINNIHEEMADVSVVLDQLAYIFSWNDDAVAIINRIREEKIARQLRRIEEAEAE